MSIANVRALLQKAVGRPGFVSSEAFSPSDSIPDFDDSVDAQTSRLHAARVLDSGSGDELRRRLTPVYLGALFLLCLLTFHAMAVVRATTVMVLAGLFALLVVVFFVWRLARFGERRLKLPIMGCASAALLLAFYLDAVAQIIVAPFMFVTMAYGLLTLSRRAALLLCGGVLLGYACVMGLHYGADGNAALLRLETLHFIALALTLPAYVLLMGRVQLLHRMLYQTSRKMRTIEETAQRDTLAGCFNRRYILSALEQQKVLADGSGIPLCLAVLDLDHFKRINDECGHLGGDEVLRAFSRLAQEHVRSDDIFGRYGGEEFLLIFPATRLLPALNTCERIRAQVEGYAWEGPLRGRVSVSIGVTQYVLGESVLEFFSRADQAMYLAKEGGRNQVVVQEPVGPCRQAVPDDTVQSGQGYF